MNLHTLRKSFNSKFNPADAATKVVKPLPLNSSDNINLTGKNC